RVGVPDGGPAKEKLVVVRGYAFDDPERARVGLAAVIERAELARPQALHVPEVEELVRDEREEVLVLVARAELEALEHERRRVAVLEAAARDAVRDAVRDERVVRVRRGAAPHGQLRADDLLDVVAQLRELVVALAVHEDPVRD